MTLTCVSVTSGNASIGKDLKAAKPPATKRIRPRTTNSGLCSAKETTRSIIGPARVWGAALGGRAAGELPIQAVQEERPPPHHLLAEVHAGNDVGDSAAHSLDFHLAPRKVTR